MEGERSMEYAQARRAYELGRLTSSLLRAAVVTSVIGFVAWATQGEAILALLPVSLIAWVFVYWRGLALLRGASFGLLGGSATLLLPLSVLRPCCDASAPPGVDCCTMPGACLFAGAVVGMLVTALAPLDREHFLRTGAGVALGMISVAIMKCSALFLGEALGLVGGLLVGALLSGAARVAWSARTAG